LYNPATDFLVSKEVGRLIDLMFERGIVRCSAEEIEAVILHVCLLNDVQPAAPVEPELV
jgi:hypothetical protein